MDFTPEQHKEILNLYEKNRIRFDVEPQVHRYTFISRDDSSVYFKLECRKHQDILVSGNNAYREERKPFKLNFKDALGVLDKWFREVTYKFENTPDFDELESSVLKSKVLDQNDPEILEAIENGVRPKDLKHALSTEKDDEDIRDQGFVNQGLIGFLEKEKTESNVPLRQVYLKDLNDYFYYTDRGKENLSHHQVSKEKILGYLSLENTSDKAQFHRYFRKGNPENKSDHFYCTNPSAPIEAMGYRNENDQIGEVYLHKKNGRNDLLPLYVFSNTSNSSFRLFESLPSEEETPEKFEIIEEAHLSGDNPTDEDLFGTRDRLAKLVVEELETLWKKTAEGAFTMHLNGEWGIGKSSMLFSFHKHLKGWKIITYNAWQYQYIDYPWWILINKANNCLANPIEAAWWKFRVRNLSLLITGGLLLLLIALMLITGGFQIWLSDSSTWAENLKVIATLITIISTIAVLTTGLFKGIFHNNITASDHIKTNASDPYAPIKRRFEALVNKRIKKGQKIAVLIDDLDRCSVEATVNLLEGIQTLFKNSKVLYIIAADGEWISNCFDVKYKDFEKLGRHGHTIGNLFLEKSIQLTVDVPNLTKENKSTLINTILPISKYTPAKSTHRLNRDKLDDIRFQINESESEEEVQSVLDEASIDKEEVGEIREEAARRSSEIIRKKHYLEDYFNHFSDNPRQIKRLINHYIVKRQELILSGVSFNEIGDQALAKYLILSSKWPNYIYEIKKGKKNLEDIEEVEVKNLIEDHLTTDLIRNFM